MTESRKTPNDRLGFLLIAAGGFARAAQQVRELADTAGLPHILHVCHIDTDATTRFHCDSFIDLSISRDRLGALFGDPRRCGPACEAVVKHCPQLLDREAVGAGARTTPAITQALLELGHERVVRQLRDPIVALRGQGVDTIQIIVGSSMGGGTGSALLRLLPHYFLQPDLRQQLLCGEPDDLLAHPIAFVVDCYVHARTQGDEWATDCILANSYAAQLELGMMEVRGEGYEYVWHWPSATRGLACQNIDELLESAGQALYHWVCVYETWRARAVDVFFSRKDIMRYQGADAPRRLKDVIELPAWVEG
ncbi:MAG: hypothetical protein HY763_01995 [Planctomycetes bacterium]|nr:hypothetical protein [Planctomycetota bacterium]